MTCKPPVGCRNSVDTVGTAALPKRQAPATSIDPRPPNWNVTLPPATTGTGAVTPPENTSCPARKPSPRRRAGWPATPPTRPGGPSPQRRPPSSRPPRRPARRNRLPDPGARAQVEATRAGVVGHHVGKGELEALIARIKHVDGAEAPSRDRVPSTTRSRRGRRSWPTTTARFRCRCPLCEVNRRIGLHDSDGVAHACDSDTRCSRPSSVT